MLLNAVLGMGGRAMLTPKEIDILVEFIKLSVEFKGKPQYVFNVESRRRVMVALRIKASNLTNYISYLMKKGAIVEEKNGTYSINEYFMPQLVDGKCDIGFELYIHGTNDQNTSTGIQPSKGSSGKNSALSV
jgi:hypothetical protein